MIQGTGSHVGKSVLTAALCRIFAQDGYKVAPFKSQNMSNNSFVTKLGGEMGRAQVMQAEAAMLEPHVDMNPILLKPTGDTGSQVVLQGKPFEHLLARDYYARKAILWDAVVESYERLAKQYEILVIEGAGSPAEVNLRENDIVNMSVALFTKAPVLLVGDIDKGGVFAWLVGTLELLTDEERNQVKGLIINKFRGDVSLLTDGLEFLEAKTGKPVLGVIPYFHDIWLDEEDAVTLERHELPASVEHPAGVAVVSDHGDFGYPFDENAKDVVDIVVVRLPRISNFTDFEALAATEKVKLRYVAHPDALACPDAIILPGTKNTLADLLFLKESGLADALLAAKQEGTHIIGICGGFQMLGREVFDPFHVESTLERVAGLGLLDIVTQMNPEKLTVQAKAKVDNSNFLNVETELLGYEIHQGETELLAETTPLFVIVERSGQSVEVLDGAISNDGKVWGTYLHGLFDNDEFRLAFVNQLRTEKGYSPLQETTNFQFEREKQQGYDKLAELVREHLDIPRVYEILAQNTNNWG